MKIFILVGFIMSDIVAGTGIPSSLDLDRDGVKDGWTDRIGHNWYCSAADVNSYQSQIPIQQAPTVFPSFIIYGGIGHNPLAESKQDVAEACCAAGTIVESSTYLCKCSSGLDYIHLLLSRTPYSVQLKR